MRSSEFSHEHGDHWSADMPEVAVRDRRADVELRPLESNATPEIDVDRVLESYRRELTAYCYRMLGSPHEAQDAVQDTLLRAWRHFETFEGRAALRSWLYRIATNVCLTMLDRRKRRALPMDLHAPSPATAALGAPLTERVWVQPVPDSLVIDTNADPAAVVVSRETTRLAFVAALQLLPPRQRAVLILRDVLQWRAAEVADLLDISVVSANGLLRRARATLADRDGTTPTETPTTERDRVLLASYVEAFERLDLDALVSLLRDDAVFSMPPYALWLRGPEAVHSWLLTNECRDVRLVPLEANGSPAFAIYKPAGPRARLDAYGIQILDIAESRITAIHTYLDPSLFTLFGMPARWDRTVDAERGTD